MKYFKSQQTQKIETRKQLVIKKSKLNERAMESPCNNTDILDRISKLEDQMSHVLSQSNVTLPNRGLENPHKHDTFEMEIEEKDINTETKENRAEFYSLYGNLKKIKSIFNYESVTQKLSTSNFETFKVARYEITAWLKTDLALSRQLEDFNQDLEEPEPYFPLLSLKSLAVPFAEEVEAFFFARSDLKRKLQIKLTQDATKKLADLNNRINTTFNN